MLTGQNVQLAAWQPGQSDDVQQSIMHTHVRQLQQARLRIWPSRMCFKNRIILTAQCGICHMAKRLAILYSAAEHEVDKGLNLCSSLNPFHA